MVTPTGPPPATIAGQPRHLYQRFDAGGCVVTPGLINTHHHLFQTRTRAYPGAVDAGLFGARLGLDEAYRFARGEPLGIQPYDEDDRPLRTIELHGAGT